MTATTMLKKKKHTMMRKGMKVMKLMKMDKKMTTNVLMKGDKTRLSLLFTSVLSFFTADILLAGTFC